MNRGLPVFTGKVWIGSDYVEPPKNYMTSYEDVFVQSLILGRREKGIWGFIKRVFG